MSRCEEKLKRIMEWCNATSLAVFMEPDWKEARKLLASGDPGIGPIPDSRMKHILDGIRRIIEDDI
jgi:hypothetical protein